MTVEPLPKIDVRIWNDAKFQSLSNDGKLCFFMLLTHPMMTALGAMRGTPEGLSAELGMTPEAFTKAFREVLSKDMAEYQAEGRLIALPNFLKYNPPASPNVVKAWSKAVEFLPECDLKDVVIQRAKDFTKGMGKAFQKALPEDLPYTERREQRDEREEPSQGRDVEGYSAGGRGRPTLAVVSGTEGGEL